MANSYFSTVFEHTADDVWSAIRDFGEYQWAGAEYYARIEGGRPGDAVGSVRIVGDDGVSAENLIRVMRRVCIR